MQTALADTRNLELRGRVWWVHRRVPDSLRNVIGRHTLRRSLDTRDLAEAQRLRPMALADFARTLEEARKAIASEPDTIAERVARWHSFAAAAVGPDGERASAADRGLLLAVEQAKIAMEHGPGAGQAFVQQVRAGANRVVDLFFEDFQAEAAVKLKTKAEQRMALNRFMAWDGNLRLDDVTREVAGLYATKGLTHTASAATKNKHIDALRAYWSWLVKRGKVKENPWTGQSFSRVKSTQHAVESQNERPFTESEMVALLSGPASPRLRDSMLILALSGMRREELSQLRVRDCDGGWFNIRAGKTAASVRRVPIHSALVSLVRSRMQGKRPDDFLIHELGPDRGRDSLRGRGAPLTQEFTRYRRAVGVNDQPDDIRRSLVNLHSFRRWFVTAAEHAGQHPWIIESVVGHKRTGMTLGVYSSGSSEQQLKDCVEAVRLSTIPSTALILAPPL